MKRAAPSTILPQLVRLDRLLRSEDEEVRRDLLPVRELLQGLVGPTVQPAEAARVLGVSQPGLKRWLDTGEIATVTTPEGRREIPTEELVSLLTRVERLRDEGSKRPLGQVMRERRQHAQQSIDPARLLPRRHLRTHRAAELHSLAYHRVVADRLDEGIVDVARRRLERWLEEGRIDQRWAERWQQLLDRPLPEIRRRISADTPQARELRQTSPFAGVLTTQERKQLVKAVEARVG